MSTIPPPPGPPPSDPPPYTPPPQQPPPYTPPPQAAAPGPVPNHLAWAIIATVLATCLCCPLGLLGIVAIVYAARVNSLLAVGDFAGAQRASDTAKTWCWVATALAIIGLAWIGYALATGQSQMQYEHFQQLLQSRGL
jgi:hypothetical protein